MINVLIVEDSVTAQSLLKGILSGDPEFHVLDVVANGQQAVSAVARLRPDVVSMDICMPVMDGLEATRQIMQRTPVPIVIISSQYQTSDLAMSFSILKAGALTILPRPVGPTHPDYIQTSRTYRNTLRMMAGIKVSVQRSVTVSPVTDKILRPERTKKEAYRRTFDQEIIAIGASAGGPIALQAILSRIPSDFPKPLLIVQHIDTNFAKGFCDWLNATSGVPVSIVRNRENLLPGHAYLPPGGAHLGLIEKGVACVNTDPPELNLRPSVNHLFRDVARCYGNKAIAILLSGMGSDGAKEMKRLKDAGALTIAQDEQSALVHGMPGEAIRMDAV